MKMTLKEAIQHCLDVATSKETDPESASEHAQLAQWLTQLDSLTTYATEDELKLAVDLVRSMKGGDNTLTVGFPIYSFPESGGILRSVIKEIDGTHFMAFSNKGGYLEFDMSDIGVRVFTSLPYALQAYQVKNGLDESPDEVL